MQTKSKISLEKQLHPFASSTKLDRQHLRFQEDTEAFSRTVTNLSIKNGSLQRRRSKHGRDGGSQRLDAAAIVKEAKLYFERNPCYLKVSYTFFESY